MRALLVIFLLSLQGCMSTGVVPKGAGFTYSGPPKNNEVIAYFYQFDMPGANSCLLVGIDDDYEGCIGYPGYAKVNISAGTRDVSFTPNTLIKISNLNFTYDFREGKEYFFVYKPTTEKSANDIEIKTQYNMLLDRTFGWYLADKKEALSALHGLKAWHKAI